MCCCQHPSQGLSCMVYWDRYPRHVRCVPQEHTGKSSCKNTLKSHPLPPKPMLGWHCAHPELKGVPTNAPGINGGPTNIGLGVRGSVPFNYSIRVDHHIDAARGVAFVSATPGTRFHFSGVRLERCVCSCHTGDPF